MQPEFEIQTPSLAASTELLVMAPIRRGFVPSLDTITYKSRVKLLLKLLHAGRQSQHEYRPLRAMSDAVERVGVIKSLRVAVVEGKRDVDDRILLSVHFDGSYEAYVRTIWQRAARLLDLIFCNAEGYVNGWDSPFDDWNAWIRSVQVSTPFFYATPGITYADQTYLQMFEHRDRGGADGELRRTRIAVPTAEEIAWSVVVKERDPTKRDDETPADGPMVKSEIFRQNLSALAGIYRLAEWYLPGTPDGRVLHNAAHELAPQLRDMFLFDPNGLGATARTSGGDRLAKALDWFTDGMEEVPPARAGTILPDQPPSPEPAGDVQAGILQPYVGVTDAVMVLLAFDSPAAAATFLGALPTTPETSSDTPANTLLVNLALTLEGLRMCGLTKEELDQWPVEFRQGMSARAGLLGDLRWNHPRRWTLPRSNGELDLDPGRDDCALPPVPLESVHAIAQFRWRPADGTDRASSRAELGQIVEKLLGPIGGIRRLSVQWLARQTFSDKENATFVDHFGYTDGQSQPELGRRKTEFHYSNQVHLGEVLVGYTNAADREQDQAINRDPQSRALMRNGSFLAVRKLRQRPAAFRQAVAAAHGASGIDEKEIRSLMMGRWPADAGGDAGKPLAPFGAGGINDFSFREDPADKTPAAAHIRRANPRDFTDPNDYPKPAPGGRPPRIMRRSMPYGPAFDPAAPDDADRGLMFMAYGASLAEQFEVIQGWLAGGNSSRGYSGAGCPFLGVPEAGMARTFRFDYGGNRTVRMALDGSEDLGTEPEPLVTLQWGLYAFSPSRSAQALLAQRASKARAAAALPWSVGRGQVLIDQLRRVENDEGSAAGTAAWKAAMEDPDSLSRFDNASIWAAVRELHGGVLRIPYGVLVGAPELVRAVLTDPATYTAEGYRRRLVAAGMGPIYLGRDPSDPEYGRLSSACNQAIQAIPMEEGYRRGRRAAGELLQGWIQQAIDVAQSNGDESWELSLDGRDLVAETLATLAEEWFGLDDRTRNQNGSVLPLFARGAMDWQWKPGEPVYYPGHFTAASRATFQAEPSDQVIALAALHGTALSAALRSLIQTKGVAAFDNARISKAVLASFWQTEPDVAVQNIAGALMGLLPTTEGILRRLLPEWTRSGALLQLAAEAAGQDLENWQVVRALLSTPLRQAIKFRPVPEQVWREAKFAHRIGGAAGQPVIPGDKVIIGQVSTLHAQLEQGNDMDVFAAFGGERVQGGATHACPGYEAAIGAMMGLLSAILVRTEGKLAPSPSPGVLVFRGTRELPVERVQWAVLETSIAKDLPGAGKRLLGFGDSWMRFHDEKDPDGSDFFRSLGALGYDTSDFNNSDYAYRGRKLKTMSEFGAHVGVYARLRSLVQSNTPPLAVLVSGGGNDFVDGRTPNPLSCGKTAGVDSKLDGVLKNQTAVPQHDEGLLTSFLDDMKRYMTTVVSNLAKAGQDATGKQVVPVILVAYDFPIPDGSAFKILCPWLEPIFHRKGYPKPDPQGKGDSAALMAMFIKRLNEAYGHVAQDLSAQGIQVRHVPLTGVLAQLQKDRGLNYDQVWKNELHPNKVGFEALARHLHEQALKPMLQPLIVTP